MLGFAITSTVIWALTMLGLMINPNQKNMGLGVFVVSCLIAATMLVLSIWAITMAA